MMRYLLITLLLLFQPGIAVEAPACQTVLSHVQSELPQSGQLKKQGNFVYVDVDNRYIHDLVPLIVEEGFEEPPYFGYTDLVGAHITVIDAAEVKRFGIDAIVECGETVDFIPVGCKVVHPPRWDTVDAVYLIVVQAPRLDLIRSKYGLPPREHDYHITIGVKPKIAKSA